MLNRFIRVADLATTPSKPGILPVSPATIWRWVRDGKFPKPIKMGCTTVWNTQDIEVFIARCATEVA